MKTKLSLIALVTLATLGAGAHAASQYMPAGEAVEGTRAATPSASDTTRIAVKTKTIDARRSGDLKEAGEAAGGRELRAEEAKPSTLARATVKAATADAIRRHQVMPAGEGVTYPMM